MINTLEKVRKVIAKVNRYAGRHSSHDEEVNEALMGIHIELIRLWLEHGKKLRTGVLGLCDSASLCPAYIH